MDPPPRSHAKLLVDISRALSGEQDAARFKAMCLPLGLRPGEVERHSVLDLLHLLDRRRVIAPGRYTKLAQTLADMGNADLVRELLPGEKIAAVPAAGRGRSGRDSPEAAPRSPRNSVVTERNLAWLASQMGRDWKQVGIMCLGMTQTDIFHCESRDDVAGRIFHMLHLWRCRLGSAATYSLLLCQLAEHVDFDRSVLEELERRASLPDSA